jgi:hypothetical protein
MDKQRILILCEYIPSALNQAKFLSEQFDNENRTKEFFKIWKQLENDELVDIDGCGYMFVEAENIMALAEYMEQEGKFVDQIIIIGEFDCYKMEVLKTYSKRMLNHYDEEVNWWIQFMRGLPPTYYR